MRRQSGLLAMDARSNDADRCSPRALASLPQGRTTGRSSMLPRTASLRTPNATPDEPMVPTAPTHLDEHSLPPTAAPHRQAVRLRATKTLVTAHPSESAMSSFHASVLLTPLAFACASQQPTMTQPLPSQSPRTNAVVFLPHVVHHTTILSCNHSSPGIVRIHPLARDTFGESGFYALVSDGPDARRGFDTPVQLQLDIDPILRTNQPLPVRISITNTSVSPIELVLFDAEDDPHHPPAFAIYLRHDDTGAIYRYKAMGFFCGTIANSPPRVLRLEPNQATNDLLTPGSVIFEASIPLPGRYSAWVVYSQCSSSYTTRVHASNAAHFVVR
jgi:hypothetical protein